ncbi:MAG: helix-turn-helix transcriptional regulator [Pseudomonadota bacterium]|nr:helix-turn-helix transcriptional regulator [Pseudomonadota bacterium]
MPISKEDSKFLKGLGLRLRQLREARGWTLEETEEHGWSSWRHLQRVESGKNVTLVTIKKLSKLYKISLSQLLKEF